MRRLLIILAALVLLAAPARADFTEPPAEYFTGGRVDHAIFSQEQFDRGEFIELSPLDELGRAGVALACAGPDYPIGARSSISQITPSGWRDGGIYHRSHLIAHRFGDSEAIENIFTGTVALNEGAMRACEETVAEYVRRGERVMIRVTPIYEGAELVPRGLLYEAESESGALSMSVTLANTQPGYAIDYATGEYAKLREIVPHDYVLNANTMRFHAPGCPSVLEIKPKNRVFYSGDREYLIDQGYKPCGRCNP